MELVGSVDFSVLVSCLGLGKAVSWWLVIDCFYSSASEMDLCLRSHRPLSDPSGKVLMEFFCSLSLVGSTSFRWVDSHAIYDSGKQVKSTAIAIAFWDAAGATTFLVPLLLDFHTGINLLYPLRLEFMSRFFGIPN